MSTTPMGSNDNQVNCLQDDKKGNILVGSSEGACLIKNLTNSLRSL